MNMTSEENIAPIHPEEAEAANYSAPKMTKGALWRMQQKLEKMRNDPERMRQFQNWQRAQQEYEQLLNADQETRRKILFHGQCILMSNFNNAVAKGNWKPRLVFAC